MFGTSRKLHRLGVLGINCRNHLFTLVYNQRKYYPLADDKLVTKKLANDAGVAVPELYGVIEFGGQISQLESFLEPYKDFVIKPAHGLEGEGVLVIVGRSKKLYRKVDGTVLSPEQLQHHVFNILSGLYSLGGLPDKAIIEYRVRPDPVFKAVSYQGVPDIRVVVFLGVPVMSMVRLPTQLSTGKANLHQGAIGVGIELTTGITQLGVWRNELISEHPDTGDSVSGITVPHWNTILTLAARCYELTGLGYLGADIVLDVEHGPMLLELNARPGLGIQIANRAGLRPRLEAVENEHKNLKTISERLAFAMEKLPKSSFD